MQYDSFKEYINNTYRFTGGGKKPETIYNEQDILNWITTCRRNSIPISRNQVISY